MIFIENLVKEYGDKKALNDLTLEIKDGEIFGLIGHNGAGKTTTIKSLVSIIKPTSGHIFINGMNLEENRDEIKKLIGYVSDSPDMFLRLSAMKFWEFIAQVYNVDEKTFRERINYFTSIFSMEEDFNKTIGEFSHGMRQKTFIIAALISNPKIWILDEPLIGLDPQSAYNLKELMKKHAEAGNTVLFSTHVLEVAEKLCNRIGILEKGKLIFIGTIDELKDKYKGDNLEDIYLSIMSKETGNKCDNSDYNLEDKE